jgi:hypothetical protein
VEDEARRRDLAACVLHANHQDVAFYEHIGYQKVKDIDDHGLDLVIMRKELKDRKA